nr:glutamate-1-semialdehyde 2,1-aminomutase [Quercus suber]
MPGGVNCPVPAFNSVIGQPILINSVKGFHICCAFGENLNLDSPRIPHYLFLLDEYILFNDIGYWSSDPASNIILQQQNIRSHSVENLSETNQGEIAAIILEPVVGNSASWCIWREIMEMVAPTGPIYQAGFLNGNPLAMK